MPEKKMGTQGVGAHKQRGRLQTQKQSRVPGVWLCANYSSGPTQPLKQLLPVKFLKHNLLPPILIYFPTEKKRKRKKKTSLCFPQQTLKTFTHLSFGPVVQGRFPELFPCLPLSGNIKLNTRSVRGCTGTVGSVNCSRPSRTTSPLSNFPGIFNLHPPAKYFSTTWVLSDYCQHNQSCRASGCVENVWELGKRIQLFLEKPGINLTYSK